MSEAIPQAGGAPVDGNAGGTPQPQHVEAPAAEPMGEAQAAAVAHLAELRTQASDPTIDRGKRDALMQKMSELSRHAFLGEKSPSWYGEQKPDPRLSDTSEYDGMAEIGAPLADSMTPEQIKSFRSGAVIRGLSPAVSGAVSSFVQELAMPKVIADQILDRAVKHYGADFEGPALTNIEPLSPEQEKEFYFEASKAHPGGSEALNKLTTEVRGMLQERGLLDRFEKAGLTRSSLAYDSRVLHALRLWCQTSPRA